MLEKDLINRLLKFIKECQLEHKRLAGVDEYTEMITYKSIALDLIQIGETVNTLSKKYPHLLELEPQIPWKRIIGLRHILVHNYDNIVKAEVEESLRLDLSNLKRAAQSIKSKLASL